MSYTRRHSALGGITTVASAAVAVVGDPCLPEVANLVLRLHASEQPSPRAGQPPAAPVKGIGLCSAVKPLRAVVWVKEQPSRGVAIAAGVVGAIFLVGYATGRSSRSR